MRVVNVNYKHKHDLEPTAPYNAYYPWDWQHHWSYYVVYLSQSFAGWHAVSAQVALDLLLCATATQLIMHYDHIARTLEKCKPKFAEARENTKGPHLARVAMELRLFDEDKRYIAGVVAYHVEVLRLSDLMNDFFGVSLFINLFTSSAIICFLGFQITVSRELDFTIKLAVFFVVSLMQVFLICHFAQQLIDSSTNVVKAVQFHEWTQAEVRYQKMLVLITARAQRPAYLNATSLWPISRETITYIMKLSYKIFALIRTMYYD
ncbi:odorant receptor 85c-like [Rhagoletis pomonella]|uniref:odorant receptor 85c-like n=1 Tax=Rhagoletis pomonella TaxID=28610 RepID=UPI00177B5784|nr:odorant receptor 85c-like [Rhagoletis pomonella]